MKLTIALFAAVLATLFGNGAATAQDSYRIKPGDILRIEVLEDSSINRNALVLPDGRISVPLAGSIRAGGRNLEQIKAEVTNKLAPNFASDPTVFVSLASLALPEAVTAPVETLEDTVDVYVLGEVARPGKVAVAEGSTVLQVLAEIGGFSKFAATKRIQLRRKDKSGQERIYNVNYKDILAGKSGIGMTVMQAGDVIIVPERKLFE